MKNTQSFAHIKPRDLGVVEFSKLKTWGQMDARLVDDAERGLIDLLSDPYYAEAYQRLLRKEHPAVLKVPGNLPRSKGKLAGRLQRPWHRDLTPIEKKRLASLRMNESPSGAQGPKKSRGRPQKWPDGPEAINQLDAYRKKTGKKSIAFDIGLGRALAKHMGPRAREERREKAAQQFAQTLRDIRKKMRRGEKS